MLLLKGNKLTTNFRTILNNAEVAFFRVHNTSSVIMDEGFTKRYYERFQHCYFFHVKYIQP